MYCYIYPMRIKISVALSILLSPPQLSKTLIGILHLVHILIHSVWRFEFENFAQAKLFYINMFSGLLGGAFIRRFIFAYNFCCVNCRKSLDMIKTWVYSEYNSSTVERPLLIFSDNKDCKLDCISHTLLIDCERLTDHP